MRYAAFILAVTFGLIVPACGSSSDLSSATPVSPTPVESSPEPVAPAPSTPAPPSPATLKVMLTDSPFSDAQALLITFSEVSAHLSGGPFVTLPFAGSAASRTCDLKKLTGAQDVLGTGPLAAGHYTQIRLVVTSATIYFENPSSGPACAPVITPPVGLSADVKIPSGEVKLNREFDLASAGATTITLDFDGDRSVKQTGNGRYMMTPVIAVVSVQ
jgi:hypothetical protein